MITPKHKSKFISQTNWKVLFMKFQRISIPSLQHRCNNLLTFSKRVDQRSRCYSHRQLESIVWRSRTNMLYWKCKQCGQLPPKNTDDIVEVIEPSTLVLWENEIIEKIVDAIERIHKRTEVNRVCFEELQDDLISISTFTKSSVEKEDSEAISEYKEFIDQTNRRLTDVYNVLAYGKYSRATSLVDLDKKKEQTEKLLQIEKDCQEVSIKISSAFLRCFMSRPPELIKKFEKIEATIRNLQGYEKNTDQGQPLFVWESANKPQLLRIKVGSPSYDAIKKRFSSKQRRPSPNSTETSEQPFKNPGSLEIECARKQKIIEDLQKRIRELEENKDKEKQVNVHRLQSKNTPLKIQTRQLAEVSKFVDGLLGDFNKSNSSITEKISILVENYKQVNLKLSASITEKDLGLEFLKHNYETSVSQIQAKYFQQKGVLDAKITLLQDDMRSSLADKQNEIGQLQLELEKCNGLLSDARQNNEVLLQSKAKLDQELSETKAKFEEVALQLANTVATLKQKKLKYRERLESLTTIMNAQRQSKSSTGSIATQTQAIESCSESTQVSAKNEEPQSVLQISELNKLRMDKMIESLTSRNRQLELQLEKHRAVASSLYDRAETYRCQIAELNALHDRINEYWREISSKIGELELQLSPVMNFVKGDNGQTTVTELENELKNWTEQIEEAVKSLAERTSKMLQQRLQRHEQDTTDKELPPLSLTPQVSGVLQQFWSKMLNLQQKKWLTEQIEQQAKGEVVDIQQKFMASQHQFECANYHRICDQLDNWFVIIQTKKGWVVGGFSDLPLGTKTPSQRSFIFSINRKLVMPLKEGRISTLNEYSYGPIFGSENDIRVDKTSVSTNYHVINSTYKRVTVEDVPTRELLMGGTTDELIDYQVFQVTFRKAE